MSNLNFLHSGGGKVTISAPDSNPASDRTLKLPSNANGTIITSTSPDADRFKTGEIVQVTTSVITSSLFLSSVSDPSLLGTYSDTQMTASITPKFADSKLIVNFQFGLLIRNGNNSGALGYGVKRNGARVITSNTNPHEQFAGGNLVGFRTTYTYVDTTHNSTSAQTYILEAYLRGGYTNMIAEFNTRGETANVVIYEVKG